MKLTRSLKLLAATFLLSSCGNKWEVPNVEPCLELASGGAFCVKYLTGEEREIEPIIRQHDRVGNVCFSPEDWGSIKTYTKATCAFLNNCPPELLEKVEHVDASFQKKGGTNVDTQK